jgi:signal peptidase I
LNFQFEVFHPGAQDSVMQGMDNRFDSTQMGANPPSVRPPQAATLDLLSKVLIVLGIVGGIVVGSLLLLRVTGLIRPFNVPTGGMASAMSPGDHVVMEAISYLKRKPKRGDIVVFKTDGIEGLPEHQIYIKRVTGEPNERLKIANGKLFINGHQVTITNTEGEILYTIPPQWENRAKFTDLQIPAGAYFVIGDNTTNSLDSRFWGCLPESNVLGRMVFCYWPPKCIGVIK